MVCGFCDHHRKEMDARLGVIEGAVNAMQQVVRRLEHDHSRLLEAVLRMQERRIPDLEKETERMWVQVVHPCLRELLRDRENDWHRERQNIREEMSSLSRIQQEDMKRVVTCMNASVDAILDIRAYLRENPRNVPTGQSSVAPTNSQTTLNHSEILLPHLNGSQSPKTDRLKATVPKSGRSQRAAPYRRFRDLGIPRAQLFEQLLESGKIQLLDPSVISTEHPSQRLDNTLFCHYHQGVGHSTGACDALKDKIQELIDEGIITKQGNKWV